MNSNSKQFKKLHNIHPNESLSLEDIAMLSGMPIQALIEVYNKGYGAFFSNPNSVRVQVSSPEQWAYGRVYSFVMKKKSTFGKADKHIAKKYYIK
jgi:hypothetical protein